jgi:MATE family multidrug resistance protein
MRPIVITIVLANLLNILLNWVLIFGHLGFPPMGAVGSAWATATSRLTMSLLLALLAWPLLREQFHPVRREVFEPAPLRRLFLLGAPIGIQHQLEYGVFGVVGLLMGAMGTNQMAGHQVALNLASVTFMVPLGVSAAAAVLVGQAVGRRDADAAHRAASASLVVAIGFMAATALVFLLLPLPLARIYSHSPEVIAVAATLIPLAGVFQVFDGIQVTSIGILRGLGDTRAPMITAVLGFWILGLPVSLWLGFGLGLGPAGLWWGLVIGLIAVAGFLYIRARRRLREPLRRVRIDDRALDDLPAPLAG